MKFLYDNQHIEFIIDNILFSVLNIALERFTSSVPAHNHGDFCYELHYVSQGYGIVRINNIAYEISPHTLYITGPHVEHEQIPFPSDPMVEYSVFFTVKKLTGNESFFEFFLPLPVENSYWYTHDGSKIYPIFQRIFEEMNAQNTGYLFQISALLQQCIITAMRVMQKKHLNSDKNTKPADLSHRRVFMIDKAFLYEYKDLTLTKLSEDLGISPRQTERFLKKYYTKSFQQKLLDARMSAASILLQRQELSIINIAEQVGYSSLESFTKAFRQYHQVTPRKFRQERIKQSAV